MSAEKTPELLLAQELLVHAKTCPTEEAKAAIRLSIATLETLLLNSQASVSLETDLDARLLLVDTLQSCISGSSRYVEDVLAKGLIKIGHQEHLRHYKLSLNEKLSRILVDAGSSNPAKRIIKDCVKLCSEAGRVLDRWHYIFLFRALEIDLTIPSVKAIRSLATQRQNQSMLSVCNLLESIVYLSQGQLIPRHCEPALPTNLDQILVESLESIHYSHLAISILGDLICGDVGKSDNSETNCNRAIPKLSLIHKGLDSNSQLETAIKVVIPNGVMDQTEELVLETLPAKQFVIFMYVLSGAVHMADITSSRCEKFLAEGQRQLCSEIELHGPADEWCKAMQMTLHLYKAQNHILHSRLTLAQEELDAAARAGPPSDLLHFLSGCLAQQSGHLSHAISQYMLISPSELAVLASLNTVLIHRGDALRDPDRATDLLSQVERYCANPGPLHTAFGLVSATSPGSSDLESRRILTRVLGESKVQANTHFNLLALSLLSARSADDPGMRRKMASVALSQATKADAGLWIDLNASLVKSVLAAEAGTTTTTTTMTTTKHLDKLDEIVAKNDAHLQSTTPAIYAVLKK